MAELKLSTEQKLALREKQVKLLQLRDSIRTLGAQLSEVQESLNTDVLKLAEENKIDMKEQVFDVDTLTFITRPKQPEQAPAAQVAPVRKSKS